MIKPKVILANGCYDLVHPAHVQLLKFARSLGTILIVAIDSDRRVAERKGMTRPINNSMVRGEFLSSLSCVALVVEFDSDEELESLVRFLEVDIMVVGSEYRDKKVVGSEHAKEGVVFFDLIPGYSSTSLIEGNNY